MSSRRRRSRTFVSRQFRPAGSRRRDIQSGEAMSCSRRRLLGAFAALPLLARPARAQTDFPSRPVRLVVGFAPGGLTDTAARALAERMAKALDNPVVVENRPGGQAIIATVAVARAAPDGLILNPRLYNNLPYRQADFRQLGSMGRSPMLLIVHPDLGVNDVQQFIALAKQKPGAITCAHAGRGIINHLALLHFQ